MSAPKGTVPWNAGTSKGWLDDKGYRWLYVTEDGRRRARREHRVVMEQKLGRRLEPWEEVHHLDHDKANNDPDNLTLIDPGEHHAHHHQGAERSDTAKARMATAARQREEIAHLRRVNAELLEALEQIAEGQYEGTGLTSDEMRYVANIAIAKARGEQ